VSVADFPVAVLRWGSSGKSKVRRSQTRRYMTIEKDGALERRFQPLSIAEPTPEEAVVILIALRERLEKHHGVALNDDALRAAVEWSVRYLPDFRLPDKALDLVDQACAAVRFRTLTPREKKSRGGTPLARSGAGRSSHNAAASRSSIVEMRVGREEIAAMVAARCGIPLGTLTADGRGRTQARCLCPCRRGDSQASETGVGEPADEDCAFQAAGHGCCARDRWKTGEATQCEDFGSRRDGEA
jgi:hypothetical protein